MAIHHQEEEMIPHAIPSSLRCFEEGLDLCRIKKILRAWVCSLNIIRSGEVEHWCGIPLILLGLERATLNIIEIRFSLLDQWMM
jgi:hypothetical protein